MRRAGEESEQMSVFSTIGSAFSALGDNKAAQNLGRSVTGNNVKAVLCIRKPPDPGAADEEGQQNINDFLNDAKAINDVAGLNRQLMSKTNNTSDAGVLGMASKALNRRSVTTYKDIKGIAEEKNYIALEVQYNPSSLRLDTTAGKQVTTVGEGINKQIRTFETPVSTTLSFELLFDDFNNMDAFMLSDNPLTGASVSNIANTVTSAVKGTYSVQRQMEGLLSLLTINTARHVIFFWGNMCFRGDVTRVNTSYTMFNKKGYPIRGKVSMAIRQGSAANQADAGSQYEDSYWNNAFDKTFTDKGNSVSKWKQATNNSLLNLKL